MEKKLQSTLTITCLPRRGDAFFKKQLLERVVDVKGTLMGTPNREPRENSRNILENEVYSD